ncbi:hypothetical protein C8F01DRAFT_1364632 [Mycena amicta]|nr:hypothetical protein C8F01DRAFT_1364632 [Mycena amicta]
MDATFMDAEAITAFWTALPRLQAADLDLQDNCPICFSDFDALLLECGVSKLPCGHIFCLKDLRQWIRNMHGNCPTCRDVFLDIRPPASDDESDGGEYIPNDEDEEEEDSFAFTSDMESDGDMDIEDDDWDRSSVSAADEDTSSTHSESPAEVIDVPVMEDDQGDSEYSSDDQVQEHK